MTPRIEIDDVVFKHLQSHAVAYVETPNDTLKRLLGLAPAGAKLPVDAESIFRPTKQRRPKASLGRLVRDGVLTNGQKLFLHDYQGRRVSNATAYVGGDGIFSAPDRKRLWSMSDLAQELLKREGFKSDSVRGPAHWFTEDGKSVMDLWEEHLRRSGEL